MICVNGIESLVKPICDAEMMSPLLCLLCRRRPLVCPPHFILMKSKTFHTLCTQRAVKSRAPHTECCADLSWEITKAQSRLHGQERPRARTVYQVQWNLIARPHSCSVPLDSLSDQPPGVSAGWPCCAADIESALWQLNDGWVVVNWD